MDGLITEVRSMNESSKVCVVLRGVSGSGKSTYARALGYEICSADDHFQRPDGRWEFNPSELPAAHAACFRKFLDALREGRSVVVDNTNTTNVELAPYVQGALAFGYEVRVVQVKGPSLEECAERNVHAVPLKTVQAMGARLLTAKAEYPPYWPAMEVISG